MTGAAITIGAAIDDAEALAALDALRAATDDLTPLWADIGDGLVANVAFRFRDGQGPGGVPWKASWRARTSGGQTLIDSGALRTSIHREADAAGVSVGTNVRYAAVHQFGAVILPRKAKALRFKAGGRWRSVKRAVIPARPFLGIDADDRADILRIATDHLHRASGGAAS